MDTRRTFVDPSHHGLSVRQQASLLSLNRSGLYYRPVGEQAYNEQLMRLIDEEYTRHPFKGVLRMTAYLRELGHSVNVKRVRRLYHCLSLEAVYSKPKWLSASDVSHKKYPYLLRDKVIDKPNQVWATDITYIRLKQGFVYLVAVMDWFSRYVLSWRLSNSLDTSFCLEALEEALMFYGFPEIFNSDQGCQFTSDAFTGLLLANDISISMDGRGRAFDNIMIERLWRSLKYEEVYLKDYQNILETKDNLMRYFLFYNEQRHHQHLGYKKPAELYFGQSFPLGMTEICRNNIVPSSVRFTVKPYLKED